MVGTTSSLIRREPLEFNLPDLTGEQILVTGSSGFIGQQVLTAVRELGGQPHEFDLENYDVLNYSNVANALSRYKITKVIHLAANKYATKAEEYPAEVAQLNIQGTDNVARACKHREIPFVLASTCKAADPCTAYGASKLIAERVALNAGGVVIRFVNVLGSTGSVIDIWDAIPETEPIPYTPTYRYYISLEEAVEMLLVGLVQPSGVYGPHTTQLEYLHSRELADRYLEGTDRQLTWIPLRRGDRAAERLRAEYEHFGELLDQPGLVSIVGPWSE